MLFSWWSCIINFFVVLQGLLLTDALLGKSMAFSFSVCQFSKCFLGNNGILVNYLQPLLSENFDLFISFYLFVGRNWKEYISLIPSL